ncbi:MAG TPA: DUF4266 domain-containing protein [Polyangia bacterium]|nr:DUF4266 domain-containing protein [Polyangia bacterium]
MKRAWTRRRPSTLTRLLTALLVTALLAGGCALVPQNRRKHLADPMMSPDGDLLLTAGRRKLYTSRESAGGGDAAPAGGGCGCQ